VNLRKFKYENSKKYEDLLEEKGLESLLQNVSFIENDDFEKNLEPIEEIN
jgi:hypothetical protein